MTGNTSPEFPISASYNRGAAVLGRFVAGVSSVCESELVKLRVAGPRPGESQAVKDLRARYPLLGVTRFLSDRPNEDEATARLYLGLSGGDADSPELELEINFRKVQVGRAALEALEIDDNRGLRDALAGRLTPKDFLLCREDPEEDTVLLRGTFGGNEEGLQGDENTRRTAAIIELAAAEIGKYDPDALDQRAIANRDLSQADIPLGVPAG